MEKKCGNCEYCVDVNRKLICEQGLYNMPNTDGMKDTDGCEEWRWDCGYSMERGEDGRE